VATDVELRAVKRQAVDAAGWREGVGRDSGGVACSPEARAARASGEQGPGRVFALVRLRAGA